MRQVNQVPELPRVTDWQGKVPIMTVGAAVKLLLHVKLSRVPPAVEPRVGLMAVTAGVSVGSYRNCWLGTANVKAPAEGVTRTS